jgi:hypothetical protein
MAVILWVFRFIGTAQLHGDYQLLQFVSVLPTQI